VHVNRETADDGKPIPLAVKIGALGTDYLEHILYSKLTSTTPLRNWATPPSQQREALCQFEGRTPWEEEVRSFFD
jgi:hypothetical protein